jgi:STE24 endopeptidase
MATSTIDARTGTSVQDAGQPVRTGGHHHTPRSTPPARDGGTAALLTGGLSVAVCVVARLPHRILDTTDIRSWGLALVVAVSVVAGARALARAPFTLRRSLHAGTGRSTALRQWAGGELKTFLATIAAGTVATIPLYALLRSTPQWWLPAWLMFAGLTVLWQLATPAVMRARASSSTPPSPALVARVRAVAEKAAVDIGDVIVTGKAGARCGNAYVVGLGRTRRVVIEHALAGWPPDLVDQVVAHELGHWRLGHTARRLPLTLLAELAALGAAAAVLSWAPLLHWAGIAGAGDPRSYPLLLVVGAVVAFPVRCLLAWRDRAQERAADRFALDLLDRPDHFAAMLQRAADDSGAPRALPWWRYPTAGHPPIDERAAACHTKGS